MPKAADLFVPGTRIPKPTCTLAGQDGNAFAIMARANRALEKARVPNSVRKIYRSEAMSGDYDHLLQVTLRYVYDED